jgi:ABC-type polysaccharide/polyol phosphate transport system ATPase subunit
MKAALQIEGLSKRYPIDRQVGVVPVPRILGMEVRPARTAGFEPDVDVDDDDVDDDDIEELEEDDEVTGHAREIWALRGITLSVAPGESLALVGSNGSGKSTLLKILARVVPPTEGRVRVRGRCSPLLSVTTTLVQPELTVAQNVRLLGDLFGVPRDVVARQMDTVLAFAEIEGRADIKLKRLSIGMARRLGISIALNLEPAVLLSDGSPAVGDGPFKERCLERVEELCAQGVTLVMASEDRTLVTRLCRQVAWLHDGGLERIGPAEEVMEAYIARERPDVAKSLAEKSGRVNEFGTLIGARIVRFDGEPVHGVAGWRLEA